MTKKQKKKEKKALKIIDNIIAFILLFIANILICISYYIVKYLKSINFYEILYYFNSDGTGTGTSVLIDGIKSCLVLFIILFILFYLPIRNSKNKKISLELNVGKRIYELSLFPNIFNKLKSIYGLIILLISLLIIGRTINVDDFYINSTKEGDIYETYYQNTNEVKITFPEEKRNLILIYLESMESSLVSRENGGAFLESRIPELENLALNNISFSNTDKLGGAYNLPNTGWTIAATVASTSGTPLLVSIGNDYDQVESFMPTVNALGDVLEKEGYNLEILQGSDIKFAGTDKYFKAHGNYKIFDYNEAIERNYIKSNYYVWWGFEDAKLFEYAKEEILSSVEEEEPFAITLFTMDTHFKDGYLDKSCARHFDDQMSNVYACSSNMVNNFIDWVKEQDFYENTTIVLIGDHLSMQGEFYKDYPDYTRTIYNAFINSAITTKYTKNREFSALDMYPTILTSIGADIEGDLLGFGVNLFSGKKTLIEELGLEKFKTELLKKSTYYTENILNDSIFDKLNEENEEELEKTEENNDIISIESGEV